MSDRTKDTSPLVGIHDEEHPTRPEDTEQRSFASVLLGNVTDTEEPEERPHPDAQDTTENSEG
ncbi:hypothetical protein [Deinococcus humi]|uniref:Uncharacterized protein n=1 Tax=Deinococcus humi TaxID=662880 RepID=A0A7W8JXR9_9DEIO|nr:hypothetical protein [Deinococcus humi]MBB5365187.1 hypothetical protein [Deinococcus humi]